MSNNKLFNDEIVEKFRLFSCKLFNLKYGLEEFMYLLENECDLSLNALCLGYIIKDYFNKAKEEFNNLEKDLEVL